MRLFLLVVNTYILSGTVSKLLQISGQICTFDWWGRVSLFDSLVRVNRKIQDHEI